MFIINNLIIRVMVVVDMFVSLLLGMGVVALLFLCGVFILYLLLLAFLRQNWRVLKKVGRVVAGSKYAVNIHLGSRKKAAVTGCEGCIIEFSCNDKESFCLTRDRKLKENEEVERIKGFMAQ